MRPENLLTINVFMSYEKSHVSLALALPLKRTRSSHIARNVLGRELCPICPPESNGGFDSLSFSSDLQ
jgi:hypothetical protein